MTTILAIVFGLVTLTGLPTAWLGDSLASYFDRPVKSALVTLPPHTAVPQPIQTGSGGYNPRAKSVVALDLASNRLLVAHQENERLPIASITKLITALVILEGRELDEVVTIPALPAYGPTDARLGLSPGQQFSVGELLKATLIPSANDAAEALAIFDAGSTADFSVKMNRLATSWGIEGTNFTTPNGLNKKGNYATALNLTKLAGLALRHPFVRQVTAQPTAVISSASGQQYAVSSTNQLLGDARVKGLKTGYTLAAGQSFVALAVINGHEVLTVVLNSPDRFGETAGLINWIEDNYAWY